MAKKSDDGSLQTTKQMLDELDALMDRMLSLPVTDGDEAPPLPEKPAVLSAKLTLLEAPVQPPPLSPALEAAPPIPPLNPPHFAAQLARSESTTVESPQPPVLTNDVTPPSVLPKIEPLLAETETPPASLGFSPLIWLNECFDNVVSVLPGVGMLLRSSGGRGALGFLGIVLSAAAFGWLLKDLLGWN
jgi:hypothetical protein